MVDTRNYSAASVAREGHDPGHPSAGLTWGELVGAWRSELGGWTALAEEMIRRAGGGVELPADLLSVERGLRRLSERGQKSGGQYGRWLDRCFGVPPGLESWVRWMGQYHRRFVDLPVSMCRRQLAMWDRPPVRDTAAGVWIDLGVASAALRASDRESAAVRIARAGTKAARAGAAAVLEHRLLAAYATSDRAVARALLAEAEPLLGAGELEAEDAACYLARHLDAMAYQDLHPPEGEPDIARALGRYEAIPIETGVAFVDFRRALGRAYCAYKRGDRALGVSLALEAADHAADGGFVRLRAMALNLASRAASGEEAARLRARALRLSSWLEDEDLVARVER
jgi:hypothetical protein